MRQIHVDLDHHFMIINQGTSAILQVASPSIDSFSTLPDQEISDFQTDSRDLQVKVDNPQKHLETLETYITFRITTRVRMASLSKYDFDCPVLELICCNRTK